MKKLFLFIVCSVLILGITSGCDRKNSNTNLKETNEVTFIEDDNFNIITKVTPDNNTIKSNSSNVFGLIIADNKKVINYVNLSKDYANAKDNYQYYKVSLLEFYVNCESFINYREKKEKYKIKLQVSVSDPITFFQNITFVNNDTFTAKDLFDNSLKNILEENLNEKIINYLENNNLEFVEDYGLTNHIEESLNEITNTKIGINIKNVDLNIK